MKDVEQNNPKSGGMLSINNLPGGVGVYELGDEIRATYMSRGLAKLLSYTPHEFHIYNELDLLWSVHEREKKRVKAVFDRLKKSHKELDISFRLQRDENKYLRILGRYSRHHGQYPVYYLVASDISEAHQNALALERQNTRLHFAFSHSTLEMWEYHIDDDLLVSLSRTILGGHAPMHIKNPQSYLLDEGYVRQDFKTSLIRDFSHLKEGREPDSILAIKTSDGSFRWLRLSYAFLSEGEDSPNRAIGIFQDVNDEIVMRLKALGQEKAFFGGFNLENGSPVLADDRVWLMMDDCVDFFQMYERVLHGAIQEPYRSSFEEIDTSEKLKRFVSKGNKELTIEAKMMHPFHQEDGYRWVRFHFSVSLANNTQLGYIAIRDIDATKLHEQALEQRAHRDGLTGIYNRFSLEDMVSKYLKTPGNKAFFLIDIDHFKLINDTYGHDMGDRVLMQFTSLIEANFPQGTIIGRLGGDEFVAFLNDCADSILFSWKRLQDAIRVEDSLGFHFTCSAGYCLSPEHGESFSELYQHADLALYHSKNHGRDQCTGYVPEMEMNKRLCLTNHEWMLDNLPDTVYLSDMQSYDLLFLNKAGRERHAPQSMYMGRKCYEVIFHRDSVCEHCRLHSLSYDTFSFWNYTDEEGNVWLCKEKLIHFNERPAKLAVLVDQLKQAREIAQQKVREFPRESMSRAEYFRELQWGGSSWDYDGEHDILTLYLFSQSKAIPIQVKGYLEEGKSIHHVHKEDRSLFRETLAKRIKQNTTQPLQIRLQLSGDSFIPVLFQWLFIKDDKSRVGGKIIQFNPSGFSIPENTLPSILNEFTVSLFVFVLEESRQTLIFANRKFLEVFETTYPELEQQPLLWLSPVERNTMVHWIQQMQENDQTSDTHLLSMGEERYFFVTIHRDVCYGLSQLVSLSIQDASNEQKMKNLNKRLIPFIEKSKEGIAVFAREGASLQLQYANATLARMLGYERETLVSNLKDTALQLFYPEDRSLLLREIDLLSMRGGDDTPFTLRLVHKMGTVIWVRITFRQEGIQGRGEPFSLLMEDLSDQMHDTSILKKTQDQLSFALNHNLLTGLYTRQQFNEMCRNYLDSHRNTRCTMVYWNIERFSILNEVLGFEKGDYVLQRIAQSLRDFVGEKGVYGHIDSDHYVACIPDELSDAQLLSHAIDAEAISKEVGFHISLAFGVYAIEDAKEHVATLLDKAHSAAKYSSAYLKEGFAYYQPSIRSDTFNEQEVLNEMYDALKHGEFTFFLQPILDLESGTIISAEALARWNHPKRGLILPNQFIPVFEKYGFITTFDLYMLSKVCTFLSQNKLTVPISLNLSRIDVSNRNIVERIIQTIEENPVDHADIQFEVTESAYIENPQNMAELVRALQGHGFNILMDDFGSGYSSLMMLSTLPFDVLKVDKGFIQQTIENKRSKAVFSGILQMASDLGIPVVVEGIESERQDRYLREIGCPAVQGFYYQRPMKQKAFLKLLRHG